MQIVQKSRLLEIFLLLFDSPATCPATFNALFRDISCNILSILISDISQNIFLKKIQAKCSIMFLYSPLPVDFVLKLEEGPLVFPYGALIYSICKSQKTLMFFSIFKNQITTFLFLQSLSPKSSSLFFVHAWSLSICALIESTRAFTFELELRLSYS